MQTAELSDDELIGWYCMQEPTGEGTAGFQDELAEEMLRQGFDV